MPAALIWLVFALGLAGAEALTGDMFLLMLSGGALAAAGSQLAAGLAGVGRRRGVPDRLGAAAGRRPPALRRKLTAARACRSRLKALEGKHALVLGRVSQHDGQVKLDGEVWTARPYNDNDVYEPGDSVTVMHIDGATAVVWKNE